MKQKLRHRFTTWYFKQHYPMIVFGIPAGLPWYVKLAIPCLYDPAAYMACVFEPVTTAIKSIAAAFGIQATTAMRDFAETIQSNDYGTDIKSQCIAQGKDCAGWCDYGVEPSGFACFVPIEEEDKPAITHSMCKTCYYANSDGGKSSYYDACRNCTDCDNWSEKY